MLTALVVALLLLVLMRIRRDVGRSLLLAGVAALGGVLLAVLLGEPFALPVPEPAQADREVATMNSPATAPMPAMNDLAEGAEVEEKEGVTKLRALPGPGGVDGFGHRTAHHSGLDAAAAASHRAGHGRGE